MVVQAARFSGTRPMQSVFASFGSWQAVFLPRCNVFIILYFYAFVNENARKTSPFPQQEKSQPHPRECRLAFLVTRTGIEPMLTA